MWRDLVEDGARRGPAATDVGEVAGQIVQRLRAAVRHHQETEGPADHCAIAVSLVHVVYQPANMVDRRFRQHAVTEVEDVARSPRGAVEDVVDLEAEFTPRREQGRGVEIPLNGALVADRLPGLVEGTPPVHTDHVAACARDLVDVVGRAHAEVDHRHTDVFQTIEEHGGVGKGEAAVVREPERDPRPGIEHLERLGARARLRGEVVRLHGDELRHETLPRGGLTEHQRLRLRERLRCAPFDGVAGERKRRAGKSDQGRAARCQLARDDSDRLECVRHGLLGGRRRRGGQRRADP